MALLAACGLLQHCKIATEGLGPYDSGQAGDGSSEQGAGGGPSGSGGFPGEAGAGQAGTGAAGTTNGSGGAGAAGDAGSAGAGGAGSGGVSGTGGAAGSGGGKPQCDAAKGEFSVPNAPTSCFFFLADDGKAVPPSSREDWTWNEAREDCEALGAQLASLATVAEYNDLRQAIGQDRGDGLTINGSIWIGASTGIDDDDPSQEDLVKSFVWRDTESTWIYNTASVEPWGGNEPTRRGGGFFDTLERCVEMRNGDFLMNNLNCGDERNFALCERDAPIVQLGAAPAGTALATDIHSYFEAREGPGAPWRLAHRARLDEDGHYDVPDEEQPFRGVRSSEFFVVLTGIITTRVDLDYGRLEPIVPEDGPALDDLSDELARVYERFRRAGVAAPVGLTLRELEAVDWERPVYSQDGRSQPLEAYAPFARGAVGRMRKLARGRSPDDVRLVFWLDS